MLNSHEFALYFLGVTNIALEKLNSFRLINKNLVNRITKVLRLKESESLILFSSNYNIQVTIENISKKELVLKINNISENKKIKPVVIYGLPILKKQSFEQAVYSLVELGAQIIQPLITQKTQHKWIEKNTEKEYERLNKIIIAACEQAKQFNVPQLNKILTLSTWLKSLDKNNNIFFDPEGESSFQVIKELKKSKPKELILLSGPEASLTDKEKEILLNYNFKFCSLTPTILRATEAVTVALGLIRSLLP